MSAETSAASTGHPSVAPARGDGSVVASGADVT
jgi:hypothetical protein